jgi:hypothetical protein
MESISTDNRTNEKIGLFPNDLQPPVVCGFGAKPQTMEGRQACQLETASIMHSAYGSGLAPANKKTFPTAQERGMMKI